jgi:hypothetical protein
MGLMDRVKAQATQLAQQTKEAAEQGKAKLDQAQASRGGAAMLRQLGTLVYADRTGRGAPDGQAKIDQLVNDISAYERENGLNLTADPAAQGTMPPQSTAPPQTGEPQTGQPQTNFPPDQQNPFAGPPPQQSQSFFPTPGSDGTESSGGGTFPPES